MVWAAFCNTGKTSLAFCDRSMNTLYYLQIIEANLLPFMSEQLQDTGIFMQDNAPAHVSNVAKAWFKEKNITLLEWPALSPDLNPMENLWAIMSRDVYDHGNRQFNSVADLKQAIIDSWNNITTPTLAKLVASMPKRCMDVLERQGKKIDY